LLHASYGVRQVIAVAEAAEKVGLSPVFSTSSFGALGEFVKAGLGVPLLPPFSLAAEIASGALAAIPVKSPVLLTPEAHVITRSGRELSNAAKSFLRHVTTQMRSFAGARRGRL
jgi:DNA-binding transcriptional LysR family regulator